MPSRDLPPSGALPGLLLDGLGRFHSKLVPVRAQRAGGDDFGLALAVNRDGAVLDPLVNGRRLDLKGPSDVCRRVPVVEEVLRCHGAGLLGIPTGKAIGIPTPSVGRLKGMATTTVGERIRKAREAKGWTKAELARQLRISAASVNDLESGKSGAPKSETLLRMRDAGINPDYVMRGRGNKLLHEIERQAEFQAMITMIEELTEANRRAVLEVVRALQRTQLRGPTSEPYGVRRAHEDEDEDEGGDPSPGRSS